MCVCVGGRAGYMCVCNINPILPSIYFTIDRFMNVIYIQIDKNINSIENIDIVNRIHSSETAGGF